MKPWTRPLQLGMILVALTIIGAVAFVLLDHYDFNWVLSLKHYRASFYAIDRISRVLERWLIFIVVIVTIGSLAIARAKRYFFPRVGRATLSEQQLALISDALKYQRMELMSYVSWPRHEPTAKAAHAPTKVDFGDAALTCSQRDQKRIRSFLGRPPRRDVPKSVPENILIVTGEPGAGKSILLQEIHASLSVGVVERSHSFLPVIVLARNLTLKAMEEAEDRGYSIRRLVVNYFRASENVAERTFADFLQREWDNFDLLVMFDGLDEIAQRSAYEEIQHRLRKFIEEDLQNSHSTHRFILSCRVDDDIAIFFDSSQVKLHGLRTDQERQRFCSMQISRIGANTASRRLLQDVLEKNSAILTSAEVFRRNPYFLTILITYFANCGNKPIEAPIDFEFLMNEIIQRETERPHAYVQGPAYGRELTSRHALRLEMERVASVFLQFFAFRALSGTERNHLYGEFNIDEHLITEFVNDAVGSANPDDNGLWSSLSSLLASLDDGKELTEAEIATFVQAGHLQAGDLRIIAELARKLNSSKTPENYELIMRAFGDTVHNKDYVEDIRWYQALARTLDEMSSRSISNRKELLALLIFARGLMAAQVLRLVYVQNKQDLYSVKLRHRRVAEYFAAKFLRDQWCSLQPLSFSPWLAPILNLVCAIEGKRCWALTWLIGLLPNILPAGSSSWRFVASAATDAAAFATKGAEFRLAFSALVETLVGAMPTVEQLASTEPSIEGSKNVLTLVMLATALNRLTDLEAEKVQLGSETSKGFRQNIHEAKAYTTPYICYSARALERLSSWRRTIIDRTITMFKLFGEPGAALGGLSRGPSRALRFERAILCPYVLIIESLITIFAGVILAFLVCQLYLQLGADQGSIRENFNAYWLGIGVVFAAWRAYKWVTAPTSAAHWDSIVAHMFWYGLIALVAVLIASAKLVYILIKAPIRAFRYLRQFLNWRTIARWVRLAFVVSLRIFGIVFRAIARNLIPVAISVSALSGIVLVGLFVADNWPKMTDGTAHQSPAGSTDLAGENIHGSSAAKDALGPQNAKPTSSSANSSGGRVENVQVNPKNVNVAEGTAPLAVEAANAQPKNGSAKIPEGGSDVPAHSKGSAPAREQTSVTPTQPVCEVYQWAGEALWRYSSIEASSPKLLQDVRLKLARDVSELRNRSARAKCSPDDVQSAIVFVYNQLYTHDYHLLPLPHLGEQALIGSSDLTRSLANAQVPAFSQLPQGPIPIITQIKAKIALAAISSALSDDKELLEQAKATGRVGATRGVTHVSAEEFPALAKRLNDCLKANATATLKADREGTLVTAQIKRSAVVTGVPLPFVLALAGVLYIARGRRSDEKKLVTLRDKPVRELCGIIRNRRYAESFRRRVLNLILKQDNISEDDLLHLNSTAVALSREAISLDVALALTLSEAIVGLERRVQLRT
jgi:hypothetical protein